MYNANDKKDLLSDKYNKQIKTCAEKCMLYVLNMKECTQYEQTRDG